MSNSFPQKGFSLAWQPVIPGVCGLQCVWVKQTQMENKSASPPFSSYYLTYKGLSHCHSSSATLVVSSHTLAASSGSSYITWDSSLATVSSVSASCLSIKKARACHLISFSSTFLLSFLQADSLGRGEGLTFFECL